MTTLMGTCLDVEKVAPDVDLHPVPCCHSLFGGNLRDGLMSDNKLDEF